MPPAPEYCLLFIDTWATCMQKAEWASWAQAIFSVLGIAAAVWIVHRQHALEQARAVENQEARDERLLQVAIHCVESAQTFVQLIGVTREGPGSESPSDRRRQLDELRALRMQVDSLPLIDLPTSTAIGYVARLMTVVQQAEALIPLTTSGFVSSDLVSADCNAEYAAPWKRLRGELSDLHAYLQWEIARLADPDVPHPAE